MYHAVEDNKLYNLITRIETIVELYKGDEKYNICQLLEDISVWIDENRELVDSTYLPFGVISVGSSSYYVSAWLFGFFIGRVFEKNELKIQINQNAVKKDFIIDKMEKNMYIYNSMFRQINNKKPKYPIQLNQSNGVKKNARKKGKK